MRKIFYIISILIILNSTCNAFELQDCFIENKTNYLPQKIDIRKDNKILNIIIRDKIPIEEKAQKQAVLKIIFPYFNEGYTNITTEWKPEYYSYGKLFILPNIYIENYKHGNSSYKELEDLIISKYKIVDIKPSEISDKTNVAFYNKIEKLKKLANEYYSKKEYIEAKRLYNQILSQNKSDFIAIYRLSEIAFIEQKFMISENLKQKVLELSPCFEAAKKDFKKLSSKYIK